MGVQEQGGLGSPHLVSPIHGLGDIDRRMQHGLVLGGASVLAIYCIYPAGVDEFSNVPWQKLLFKPRVLLIERVAGGMRDWLPFMEGIAEANEGILLVTESIVDEELLATFIINDARGRIAEFIPCIPTREGRTPLET